MFSNRNHGLTLLLESHQSKVSHPPKAETPLPLSASFPLSAIFENNALTPWLQNHRPQTPTLKIHPSLAHHRLWLLPPTKDYLTPQAQTALAHLTAQQLGEPLQNTTLWLSPRRYNQPQLACAIDTTLIEKLQALAQRHHLHLQSIQPLLTALWDKLPHTRMPPHLLWVDADRCLHIRQNQGNWQQLQIYPRSHQQTLETRYQTEGIWVFSPHRPSPIPNDWREERLANLTEEEQTYYRPVLWGY